jgi:putative transposase
MARLARIVIPGLPHHVTQPPRHRRGKTFFEESDYALYIDLLAEASARARTGIRAYCLMPNHVHIILVPSDEDGLRRTFADLHRRYTGYVNASGANLTFDSHLPQALHQMSNSKAPLES